MIHTTNNHPAMNSITGAGLGAYTTQAVYPQTEDVRPIHERLNFRVETVENGYVLSYGHDGMYGKTYICQTPQDLADRIIASMVTTKMEGR